MKAVYFIKVCLLVISRTICFHAVPTSKQQYSFWVWAKHSNPKRRRYHKFRLGKAKDELSLREVSDASAQAGGRPVQSNTE
ncbi:uncharacterized protein BDZ83DRAFT_596107 [Colletotrichum acutatum]|uniref:Secreted protein n=1 Tax=Glomerella acutata TaxID=27357 RepID=A0AAD8XQE1_GLOAC|nr:uncharacterized protein BDZ83DRAFT_596107 [Colletotrichum acutatum]KAK1731668.1 hypothetical protein BDZ83DRAFT_596107 [Colletotrichum acutatum]